MMFYYVKCQRKMRIFYVKWQRKVLFVMLCAVITLFHSFSPIKVKYKNVPERELKLLQVLFRHGHRTPFSIYPNDPIPKSYWIEGLGKLTMLGRVQHYSVGQYLRGRYSHFITRHPQEVHCLSSKKQRCRYGAFSLLAGMYPPAKDKLIAENLYWQPIPVEYTSESKDRYLQCTANCPTSDNEKKLTMTSQEGVAFTEKYTHLYDFWSNCSGLNVRDYDTAGKLYKTLLVQKTQNLTIPDWAADTWEDLKGQGDMAYYFNFKSNITHRLRGGPLVELMLNKMKIKMVDPDNLKKVYLYSGHGSNVAAFLNSLNLFNNKMPPFASFITLELYKSEDQQYTIRMLYTNGTDPAIDIPEPNVLVLPGCTEYCPFEFVEKYTEHLIPENYEMECGIIQTEKKRRHTFFFV